MSDSKSADLLQKATQWWSTEIIDMKPGVIRFRGFPIEQLIGRSRSMGPGGNANLEICVVACMRHSPDIFRFKMSAATLRLFAFLRR